MNAWDLAIFGLYCVEALGYVLLIVAVVFLCLSSRSSS